jgi:CheY-like chemotaxis protein
MGHAVLGRKITLVVNGTVGRNRTVYYERNPVTYSRIMIVEDNPMLRLTLAVALSDDGLEIVSAAHGIEALRLYQDHVGRFDAIVTDNEMPNMDGLELVRSVREMGFRGRIVVMSGNMKMEQLRAYQEFEISGFFQKPFETSSLAAMLFHA